MQLFCSLSLIQSGHRCLCSCQQALKSAVQLQKSKYLNKNCYKTLRRVQKAKTQKDVSVKGLASSVTVKLLVLLLELDAAREQIKPNATKSDHDVES